jgi:hypothetical protein
LPRITALIAAIALSGAVLFGVGVYSSVTLVGDWRKNGLKMVAIGLGAAAVGFIIGHLSTPPEPDMTIHSRHRPFGIKEFIQNGQWCLP